MSKDKRARSVSSRSTSSSASSSSTSSRTVSSHTSAHKEDSRASEPWNARSTRSSQAKQNQNNRSPRVVSASSLADNFVDPERLQPASEGIEANINKEFQARPRSKVVDFNERKKEQRVASRRYWILRIAIAVLSLGVVIFAVWALIFSPWLKVNSQEIHITGMQTWVKVEQIQRYTNDTIGKSLILVSESQLENSIDSIPGVGKAEVSKQFPHGINVTITEETPTALLYAQDKKNYVAVDAKAQQIATVNEASAGIPVINVPTVKSGLRNETVLQSIAVLAALDAGTRSQVVSTTANTQDSITTVLSSGYTIVWGNSSNMDSKQQIVAKIIQQLQAEGSSQMIIDVSAPARPIIR
ncbi:FtsQ-type POTRA domain-containing protein [Alloscardovia theropitheci]|uniref:FtsQ-type POTRA domain-containing protein n=1 Tax=Alloscardovia theropitheci TaxID=2496842 RepID=A0A4R0QP30_9BIFI|nr:FtsQ-type POTRA domain-containing protein [Alloscardovia theropitheci]TCD53963.1 FtsQ-type POTRA domain-containing protein [Alloscardovia theropitheci]